MILEMKSCIINCQLPGKDYLPPCSGEQIMGNHIYIMNKGVNIHCKSVTAKVFTVVGLLVEISTYIYKTKGFS